MTDALCDDVTCLTFNATTSNHVTDSDAKCFLCILSWVMIKKNNKPLHWILPTCFLRQFENKQLMTFSNFALRYHKDIDHWVIYHVRYVCEKCRRSLNHFSILLFLRQNVRVVNLSITHDYLVPFLSFNVSRSSGNSNSNMASVMSDFGLGLRQFVSTAAQSLRFLQNMVLRVIFVD